MADHQEQPPPPSSLEQQQHHDHRPSPPPTPPRPQRPLKFVHNDNEGDSNEHGQDKMEPLGGQNNAHHYDHDDEVEEEHVSEEIVSPQPHLSRKRTISILRKQRRAVNKKGETIYKGHQSYGLVKKMQLGLSHTILKTANRANRDIKLMDFRERLKVFFPKGGCLTKGSETQPHDQEDFQFKDYSPVAFAHIRGRFNIDSQDFVNALAGDGSLTELSTPGKSGSVFFFSHGMEYIIKTVTKKEAKVLQEILPFYYNHIMQNQNTLICRFYGFYRVKPLHGSNVRFVVMNNVFPTDLKIHETYDLKGSTVGRSATFENRTTGVLKDNDLRSALCLKKFTRDQLEQQIRRDCKFLESIKVMDYSLLLGIRYRNKETSHWRRLHHEYIKEQQQYNQQQQQQSLSSTASSSSVGSSSAAASSSSSSQIHNNNNNNNNDKNNNNNKNNKNGDNNSPSGITLRGLPFGRRSPSIKITTSEIRVHLNAFQQDEGGVFSYERNGEPRPEVYYLGIIDILQKWNMRKKMERFGKGIREDRNAISAVPPSKYSKRFQEYIIAKLLRTDNDEDDIENDLS